MGKKDSNKDTSVVFLYDESSAALQTALKGIKPAGAKVFGLDNNEIETDSTKKEKVEEKIKARNPNYVNAKQLKTGFHIR